MENKTNIAAELVGLLLERGWHISFAESCTGGAASARIVDVPGASDVMDASVVTYAESAKVRFLGVSPDTISRFGVVSEEVAGEMAAGAARLNGAEVGAGITGLAGPGGGEPGKPVGTVCFGVSICGEVQTFTCHFGDIGRNNVRRASVDFILEKILNIIRN